MPWSVRGRKYYTIREASEITGYTTGYIRLLLGKGEIKGTKPGSVWLVTESVAKKLRDRVVSSGRPRRGARTISNAATEKRARK